MALYERAIAEIRKECPHFTLNIIVQGLKALSLEKIEDSLRLTIETLKKHPKIIVGYDLVMVKYY
jgi:hypothetical protein